MHSYYTNYIYFWCHLHHFYNFKTIPITLFKLKYYFSITLINFFCIIDTIVCNYIVYIYKIYLKSYLFNERF